MAWRETVVKKILGLMFVLATSLALVGAAGATGTTYDKGKQGKYENYKPKHSRADYKLAFKTHLNGANEVPPVKTDTTGKTAFLVNQDYSKMKFVLKVYGGESIFGAAGAHTPLRPQGSERAGAGVPRRHASWRSLWERQGQGHADGCERDRPG